MKHFLFFTLAPFFIACNDPADNPNNNNPTGSETFRDGITRISDDSLAFVLLAPGKETVYLLGDFNEWQVLEEYKMEKDGER
ncbi:MAG: alpha-amylase, partial [Tannerella sp.]|nr:alpha-amylase [Tannerella sp.]